MSVEELRKLHREGINNATNSVTVVAMLFATVAFAALFTVPSGDDNNGMAVTLTARTTSLKIFFVFNVIALFTSLAVLVVQITLVRGETKAKRRVVDVINKLMWLASVCTFVAFIASSYVVVGRQHEWAATQVKITESLIMVGVLGTMTYSLRPIVIAPCGQSCFINVCEEKRGRWGRCDRKCSKVVG